jgi:hypothetical protein
MFCDEREGNVHLDAAALGCWVLSCAEHLRDAALNACVIESVRGDADAARSPRGANPNPCGHLPFQAGVQA